MPRGVRPGTGTPSPGEEVINTYIKRKQESFELLLLYKSGEPYSYTTFAVPAAQADKEGLTAYTKKRESQLLETLSKKSGDDLLSHKRNVVEFVGAGSNRSHAAWTEFMPVRVADRRHHQERGH